MTQPPGHKEMGAVPEFSFDFVSKVRRKYVKILIVLVGRMGHTRTTLSTVVPAKSTWKPRPRQQQDVPEYDMEYQKCIPCLEEWTDNPNYDIGKC